jgi:glycosyltransferase involved in cell wall biosynthesis
MRVAIDGRAIGSGAGGDESYTRGLLLALQEVAAENDTFPVLVSPGAQPPDGIAGDGRFPVMALGSRSQLVRYTFGLPRALSSLQPAADLVHCINYAPPRSPLPIALQVADLSFVHHPSYYKPDTLVRLNTLVPFLVRRARVVLTVSEFSRRDIIDTYRIPAERVFVVPNAIRPSPHSEPAPDHAEHVAGLGVRPPFFAYIGNLHPRKNVARMIKAFVRARSLSPALSEHRLVIAGTRWWGGGDEEREARRAPAGSVSFLGRVSDEDRDRLMMDAEAVLYPSIFEGFGLPPLEAMALGTPVLSSTRSALPEVLGDAALLVDPYDVEAMAAGMVALATDGVLRDRLRAAGPRRAELYSPRVMGERAMEAFRWALGAGRDS